MLVFMCNHIIFGFLLSLSAKKTSLTSPLFMFFYYHMRQVFSGLRVMLCRTVFVLFVPFLCVIVLSVLLRFVAFDYLFGIYNILFTHTIKHTFSYAIGVTDRVMVFNAQRKWTKRTNTGLQSITRSPLKTCLIW
jgi:hypothetical protein